MTDIEKDRQLREKLNYFFKGNLAAVEMCMQLTFIAHVWDDLIDKDKVLTDHEISTAFRILLVDLPYNPFYTDHIVDLRPLIMNVILQWWDANVLERGSDHDRHMAYMLRASFLQIFNYCAYLIGGPDWAGEVGPDMRRLYEESLESFMEEMNHA